MAADIQPSTMPTPHDLPLRPSAPPSTSASTSTTIAPPLPSPSIPSVPLPPAMAEHREKTADEVLAMLNRVPLFMTDLDAAGPGGSGGGDGNDAEENIELEAMRALAHEGSLGERARNWRAQGNEVITEGREIERRQKVKFGTTGRGGAVRWEDAREYYSKALGALREARRRAELEDVSGGGRGERAEEKKEKEKVEKVAGEEEEEEEDEEEEVTIEELNAIEEACRVNRALCNLELKNYGSSIKDCAAVLTHNPRNVKALYRSSLACFALDKIADAEDACARVVAIDPTNSAAKTLLSKIRTRKDVLDKLERERIAREDRVRAEAVTLRKALGERKIYMRTTANPPADVEDAVMKLERPLDAQSTLQVPVLLLYPTHAQTDLVKAFAETDTLNEHLAYILPPPWDSEGEFTEARVVDCFMDTREGGLIKVGKKVPLVKTLSGGKAEVVDGIVRVFVVPSAKVAEWIEEVKRRQGR